MFVAAHDGETVLIILHLRQNAVKTQRQPWEIQHQTTKTAKDDKVPIATVPNDHTFPIIHHGLSPCVFPLRRSHFTSVPLLASSRGDEVPQRCQKLNKGLVTNAVKRIETRQVEHGIYAKFPQKALFLHIVYHRMWLRMWPEVDVKRYYF